MWLHWYSSRMCIANTALDIGCHMQQSSTSNLIDTLPLPPSSRLHPACISKHTSTLHIFHHNPPHCCIPANSQIGNKVCSSPLPQSSAGGVGASEKFHSDLASHITLELMHEGCDMQLNFLKRCSNRQRKLYQTKWGRRGGTFGEYSTFIYTASKKERCESVEKVRYIYWVCGSIWVGSKPFKCD